MTISLLTYWKISHPTETSARAPKNSYLNNILMLGDYVGEWLSLEVVLRYGHRYGYRKLLKNAEFYLQDTCVFLAVCSYTKMTAWVKGEIEDLFPFLVASYYC